MREIQGLVVAGDGRADSPGHSAKYGAYSMIEQTCNKVVDLSWFRYVDYHCVLATCINSTFFQSNEEEGSYHTEKERLMRVIQSLQQHQLPISVLVTDRHKQINKWLRETRPDIQHYYDIWHVAKGGCMTLTFNN